MHSIKDYLRDKGITYDDEVHFDNLDGLGRSNNPNCDDLRFEHRPLMSGSISNTYPFKRHNYGGRRQRSKRQSHAYGYGNIDGHYDDYWLSDGKIDEKKESLTKDEGKTQTKVKN